jgi:hypothetical protein
LVVSLRETVPITKSTVPSLVTVMVFVVLSEVWSISLLPKLIVPEGETERCATGAATAVALRLTGELVWLWPLEVMVTVPLKDWGGEADAEVKRAVIVA